jgi:hypothetical protein
MVSRMPKKHSKTERKLNLIYEVLLHISKKVLSDIELADLAEALIAVETEAH